jgi:hypothetical protein
MVTKKTHFQFKSIVTSIISLLGLVELRVRNSILGVCVSAQRLERLTESGEQADLATNKDTPGALPGPGSYGEG